MKAYQRSFLLFVALQFCVTLSWAQSISTVASNGWANNSVNTVIFRRNSLDTFDGWQYAAYYDQDQYVVLAKRRTGDQKWTVSRTSYLGNATDAHRSISMIVDGHGYIHVAWGHHNDPLNYAVGMSPGSLQLGAKRTMIGVRENKLTYPEFYHLANGDVLFTYRDGGSGNGNYLMSKYSIATKKWTRVQEDLIDGEGKRNAYCQLAVDHKGTIHLSWVWRESPDVASNHDLAYACSKDGGRTWQRSNGELYQLPITATNAEYACRIPQRRELINQTSMTSDGDGHPYIATYWRDSASSVPQYHVVYHDGKHWNTKDLAFRRSAFSLSGGGTKSIPISRPQIVAWKKGKITAAALIFRDEERSSKVSLAVNKDLKKDTWKIEDLGNRSVGAWEPTYDTRLWDNDRILNLFVQKVTQIDGEGVANSTTEPVQVWQWMPPKN